MLYHAYGLNIQSALPLPELASGGGGADVNIRFECLKDLPLAWRDRGSWRVSADETSFRWPDIGTFAIRRGREILVDPRPGVDQRWIQVGVLGPGFAALLQQRGYLVLHASAVSIGGSAVAFMGASGWGKSTLAAALHGRGHPVVGDDILATDLGTGTPVVFSGFPHFKLWPQSVAALGGSWEELPRATPDAEKRMRPMPTGFVVGGSHPLARIYVLARGERTHIEPLTPRDAFLELVAHSYGIDWLHPVSGPSDFSRRAELARAIQIRRLTRPWELKKLSTVADLVEQDVASPG